MSFLGVKGRTTIAFGLLWPLAACSGESAPDDTVTLVDEGALCLFAGEPSAIAMVTGSITDGAQQDYVVGEPILFQVRVSDCLSSSCDVDRVASCGVAHDGQVLTVSSHLSYQKLDSPHCTMDCGALSATCASEPLVAGSYTVLHGEQSFSVDVPSSSTACAR